MPLLQFVWCSIRKQQQTVQLFWSSTTFYCTLVPYKIDRINWDNSRGDSLEPSLSTINPSVQAAHLLSPKLTWRKCDSQAGLNRKDSHSPMAVHTGNSHVESCSCKGAERREELSALVHSSVLTAQTETEEKGAQVLDKSLLSSPRIMEGSHRA